MELFNNDTHSKSKDTNDDSKDVENGGKEGSHFGSLSLRLDSLEDTEDTAFNFLPSAGPENLTSKYKGKAKATLGLDKPAVTVSDLSQESSQSMFDRRVSSEFSESCNSLEASNESSRIPPGQGEGSGKVVHASSGRNTPELFTPFSRLRNLLGGTTQATERTFKKVLFTGIKLFYESTYKPNTATKSGFYHLKADVGMLNTVTNNFS